MPVQDIKGLKGLKGWTELTEEEKESWLDAHPQYRGVSTRQMLSGYANQNFVDEFGRENFAKYDRKTRDLIYRNKAIDSAVRDTFKDDENLDTILKMTPEAQLELFDSDYLEKQDKIDRRKEKNETSRITNNKEGFDLQDIIDPLGIGRGTAKKAGEFQINITEKSKDNILADINARDLYRKKDSTEQRRTQIASAYKAGLESGQMSEQDVKDTFSKIAEGTTEKYSSNLGELTYEMPGSRVYKAYKNSHEMSDFGLQDMIDTVAEYQAMRESYGTETAQQYLDTKMQDYIADHQNVGDWVGAAFQGVATKFAANIMGVPLFLESMAISGDKERLANWIEGKDENGEDLPLWHNPQYWNGVDQFGSFSPEYINRVKEEYGGISKYNWLTPVGQEMNFANTMNEAAKMAGYMAAGMLVSRGVGAGTGGLANIAGKAGSQAAKAALEASSPYIIAAVNAMGISEAYAMGTYDQVLQEANEKIDNKRYADAQRYAESMLGENSGLRFDNGVIEGTTRESNAVAGMLNEYVRARTEEILAQRPDLKLEDINQDALYNEGLTQYAAILQQQYLEDHDSEYNDDREMARRAGATAYFTDALLEELRMFTSGLTYKKWMMSKADRAKLMDKYPNRKAVDTAEGLVGKTTNGRSMEWGNITPVLRNIWGGARDNYLDDVTVAFAKGFGLDKFNNYFESGLSPKEYAAATDGISEFLSGVVAGAAGAELSMIDKQSFHDGLVGGLGGAMTIAPRIGNIVQRKAWGKLANYDKGDVARAALERNMRLDEYLNNSEVIDQDLAANKIRKMNGAEIVGEYVFNPLLQDYTDAVQRNRDFQYELDVANKVIADNIPKINDIVQGSAILNENLVAEKDGNLADLKDSQVKGAFFYATQLERMKSSPIYSQSMQVQEELDKLDRLSQGKPTEQDIKEFLDNPANKSVKDDPNSIQIAAERLQKNAQQMNQIREAYVDAMKVVKDNPNFQLIAHQNKAEEVATQLAFNTVMYTNREERISKMEEQLRNSTQISDISSPIALYGSEKGRQDNENYYQRAIENQEKKIDAVKKAIEAIEAVKVKGRDFRESKGYRVQALNLQLKEEQRILSDLKAKLQDTKAAKDADFSRVLSEDEIMALNPVERAEMFRADTRADYSPAQKKVIERLTRKLRMKDPSLLQTIQDSATLTQRNEDITIANSIMQENLPAAVAYYEHAEKARKDGVNAVWNQRLRDGIDSALEPINLKHEGTLRRAAKKFSSSVLGDYIDRHPESKDALTPTLEMIRLREDADNILLRMFDGDMAKINRMRREVDSVVMSPKSKTEADVMSALEDIAESNKNTQREKDWDELLSKLQAARHTRDATKVQERSERKKQESAEVQKQGEQSTAAQQNTAQVERVETADEHHTDDQPSGAGISVFQDITQGSDGFTDDGSVVVPTPEEIVNTASRSTDTIVVKPVNENVEEVANNADVSLRNGMVGNVLFEYEGKSLMESGLTYTGFENKTLRIAERKTPYKSPSALTAYYQWEDATGFNIQEIIDDELGKIMDVADKDMPAIHFVKFKDSSILSMESVVFNAIELTDRVRKIHGEDNKNGVILIGDTQYLIIGTLGYNKNYEGMKDSFDTVSNSFDDNAHNNKEYYLSPYTTKFDDIYSGYIVDSYGRDDAGELRTIKSLLGDKKANPHGITYANAVWGIMHTKEGFVVYGKPSRGKRLFSPRNIENNIGEVFLMVPSSNGNYIPIALEPAHIGDLAEGSQLRGAVERAVNMLTNEDRAVREEGLKTLSEYLVFTKGVQEVKFTDGSHTNITIIKSKGVALTYRLSDINTAQSLWYEIMQATPFRVNISAKTLMDKGRLKIYDDAGALKTTAAKLGTVNTRYTVLRVDTNGKTIEKVETPAPVPQDARPTITGNKVTYLGNDYIITPDKQVYDMNGRVLNDKSAFAVRAFNHIVTQNLSPEHTTDRGDQYYRISPTVVVFSNVNGKISRVEGEDLVKYNARLEQQRKDDLARRTVKENGNLNGKKLSIVSENTDKSYNFTKEMRNARSVTYQAVGEFLTKKGIKDVKGLTIKQMKEELTKYKISLDTVTDEKSFIDMLNNCL